MRVAVAGGTGLVGRMVVRDLERAGHQPVVLSRAEGVDLTTGDGLVERLRGSVAVIDVSNKKVLGRKAATEFFGTATSHLLKSATDVGVEHVITLSIVGIDDVGLGYYQGKRRQEELVRTGPLPWTILRATQFHEFPEQLLDHTRGPVAVVPGMLSRPVAAAEVAAELVALVDKPAAGYVRPIAGPEDLWMVDMVRRTTRVRGDRKLVLPVKLPGRVGRAMTSGALLPQGPFIEGKRTFAEHLAALR
jgi:uncharacterized protein YbjT (DUF2867 family)